MIKCDSCGVNITGKRSHCPLCGKMISGGQAEDYGVFPKVRVKVSYDLIVKITTFAAIVAILVINIINFSFIPHLKLYVPLSLGVGCAWLIIVVGVRKRKNIPKNILYEGIISVLLCLLWDKVTGWHGWSVNYVIPITFAAMNVFYFVMSYIDRSKNSQYQIYFVLSLFGTLISVILWLTGAADPTPFVTIPIGVGVSLLIAELIFRGKKFVSELHRRFHV
ncbi:MAG: hypothetical protein E7638_02825 [Ruminococcaceae bacterium]|nr:hypothetical protein [Oscillospiraceae bacterium]